MTDENLAAAIWQFLPQAPRQDREMLLAELTAALVRLGRFENAYAVAQLMEHADRKAIAVATITGAIMH